MKNKHVGFTGTRLGMTPIQKGAVKRVLESIITHGSVSFVDDVEKQYVVIAHHGDCVGADEDFHKIAEKLQVKKIVIHPAEDEKLRAFCQSEFIEAKAPFLKRNRNIVDKCGILIATPSSEKMFIRGGTWSTIRYAQQQGKRVVKIFPDGKIEGFDRLFLSAKDFAIKQR